MLTPNYISFRDPVARVFKQNSLYYRYIFVDYKNEYDHLMKSGLYQELIKEGLLIPHEEVNHDVSETNVYKLLFPTQLPVQTYPFEWTFNQWKRAINCYLKINKIALKYGMILKDATPYNFNQLENKFVLFDTSSFIFFRDNDKWLSYRQFSQEFLGPIALIYFNGDIWSKLTMSYKSGLPLSFISKQLPIKSWFNFSILLHIHAHSKYNNQSIENTKNKKAKGFNLEKINSLQDMILKSIKNWKSNYANKYDWENYYEKDIESQEYLNQKESIVEKWIAQINPKKVVDIGANNGKFSIIAAKHATTVIALESDGICVEALEEKLLKEGIENIYPIVGNLASPSPSLGILNKEVENIYNRCYSDLALALAIVHHLHITEKMPFIQISELLKSFTSNYLIVEFIGKKDEKIGLLNSKANLNLDNYTETEFINSLSTYFTVEDSKITKNLNRTLYLLKRN